MIQATTTLTRAAFAKVYNSKMPVTAVDTLYERVLPFYEAIGVNVGAILTDNGREFCGLAERYPYELFCLDTLPAFVPIAQSTEEAEDADTVTH